MLNNAFKPNAKKCCALIGLMRRARQCSCCGFQPWHPTIEDVTQRAHTRGIPMINPYKSWHRPNRPSPCSPPWHMAELFSWERLYQQQWHRKALRRQSIGGVSHCLWSMACPFNALFTRSLPAPLTSSSCSVLSILVTNVLFTPVYAISMISTCEGWDATLWYRKFNGLNLTYQA